VKVARILALLLVAAGIAIAFHYHLYAVSPVVIRNAIAANPLAPVIFIALQVAASLLFVPRTVMGIAAGLLFGFAWGLLWAVCGAMAGAGVALALVRWFGVTGVLDQSPGLGAMVKKAEAGGWRAVAILRLTPVPHSVTNALLAMTNLSWRDYLIGSFFGMLPMTIAQVDIGASGSEILNGRQWLLACLMLALGLAATFLLRRLTRGSQPGSDKLD
jgi:uncharacterized membrane protein YdjX (TVP38/TMEM64 family)